MSFLGKLFGKDSVIEAGINGIDKVVLTSEEKTDAHLAFLKLYEPFKLAQRYLALILCTPYAVILLGAGAKSLVGYDVDAPLAILSGDPALIVGTILAFYFGGGAVEGILERRARKK